MDEVIQIFSRSSYPVGLSKMLYDQIGSEKSNMVAFELEVPIPKLVDKIGTKVQYIGLYVYEVQQPNRTNGSVLRPYTRKCNSKMASLKPEILISQLKDKSCNKKRSLKLTLIIISPHNWKY